MAAEVLDDPPSSLNRKTLILTCTVGPRRSSALRYPNGAERPQGSRHHEGTNRHEARVEPSLIADRNTPRRVGRDQTAMFLDIVRERLLDEESSLRPCEVIEIDRSRRKRDRDQGDVDGRERRNSAFEGNRVDSVARRDRARDGRVCVRDPGDSNIVHRQKNRQVDLRGERSMSRGHDLRLFGRVFNMFDTRAFNGFVFNDTGSPDYTRSSSTSLGTLADPTRFHAPRRVEVGISAGGFLSGGGSR